MDNPQKCWTCAKACGGCSWTRVNDDESMAFEPVPGWTAKERPKLIDGKPDVTYMIIDCPDYRPDTGQRQGAQNEYTAAMYDSDTLNKLMQRGLSVKEIAGELGVSDRTAYNWRRKAAGEDRG